MRDSLLAQAGNCFADYYLWITTLTGTPLRFVLCQLDLVLDQTASIVHSFRYFITY